MKNLLIAIFISISVSVFAVTVDVADYLVYLKNKTDQSTAHLSDTVIHVLSSDKLNWNSKVDKSITNGLASISYVDSKTGTSGWSNTQSATNWLWTSNGSEITLTNYSGPNVVIIPDILDGLPVTSLGTNLFSPDNVGMSITSVTGGNNLNRICVKAFYSCPSLSNVQLPSVQYIEVQAFPSCNSLVSIIFPNVINIDDAAFGSCASLKIVDLPLLKNIGQNVFNNCHSLTSLSFPSLLKTSNNSLGRNNNLVSVYLPSITNLAGNLFYEGFKVNAVYFSGNAPIASTAYSGINANQVTNYVINPTATGWGTTLDGMPVVRMPLYGDASNLTGITNNVSLTSYVNNILTPIFSASKELTGFENPDSVSIAYNTNRTVTLTQTGGIPIWWRGIRSVIASPYTSSQHDIGLGLFYLAGRTSTNFEWSTSPWTFDMIQVAYVHNNGFTVGFRECHGIMQWQTHETFHRNTGTYRLSGLDPDSATYALNTNTDAANTPAFNIGYIEDEDLETEIPATTDGKYSILYFTGSNTAVIVTNYPSMFRTNGVANSYAMVNSISAGIFNTNSFSQNGRWLNYYQIVVPVMSDSVSQEYRTLILQPQVLYTSLASAQAEDFRSLNLGELSAIAVEFVAFTKFVVNTANGYTTVGRTEIVNVSFLTGSKATQVSISQLNTPNTASSISANTANFSGLLSTNDTTVQLALDTIDDSAAHANPVIAIIQGLTNNGTITLFPNTPQLLSMLATNINYTIEFSDTGYISNRLNYVDIQIEKTNNCTLIWPTNVMGWVSGSEPSWRNGVNWIYFEKRRDIDKWLGVAQ